MTELDLKYHSPNDAKPVLSAAAVKLSKAKIRAIVFKKCGGKCAYCGVDLVKGWNVDHIKPQIFGGTNDLDNLNPSCKDCNNYKCHTDLEGYRKQLHKMLNEKLEYLFKSKTKMQVAMNMGSIKHTLWDGKFHFERVGVGGSASQFEEDTFKLINAYVNEGLSKPDLVRKMK
jgi:hypothetical protein